MLINHKIRPLPCGRKNELGAAIIMALLFMALATAIVVAVAFRQSLNVAQTELILESNTMWLAQQTMVAQAEAKLAELLAKHVMYTKKSYDDDGNWRPIVFKQVLKGVSVKATILDAQAYFNINNLAFDPSKKSNSDGEGDLSNEKLFKNILDSLSGGSDFNPDNIFKEAQAYVSPKAEGVGAGEHIPMSSITELRLLPSMTGVLYSSFFQGRDPVYLFALPISFNKGKPQQITMNINTMSKSLLAKVLRCSFERPIDNLDKLPEQCNYKKSLKNYFGLESAFFLIKVQRLGSSISSTVTYSLIQVINSNGGKEKLQFQLIWFSQGTV